MCRILRGMSPAPLHAAPLTENELNTALQTLPLWRVQEGARQSLRIAYKFADFKAAFAFMTRMADKAEQLGHHPEWFNVYNRVEITLTTHDAGNKITALDITLAQFADKTYAEMSA